MTKYITHTDITFIGEEKTTTIYYMAKDGISFGYLYWYNHQEKDVLTLAGLSVAEKHRKKGLGTELQKIREKFAKDNGFKKTQLWVRKGTWMYDWYLRRGYKYDSEYDEHNDWLKKDL